ncbi:MAG: single-stranded-DNA-specific exonuclease RecJ [Pseudanabaenaceae cyanobacterium bins.68]|nr:single-stranded-DNA-specific exonuclease RecJ [Pseudanabaenaceae cyanobacterium bins.68]
MALPHQRWRFYPPNPSLAEAIAQTHPGELAQFLINRGIDSPGAAADFLCPPTHPPDPKQEFPDLIPSLDCLERVRDLGQTVAICGDYDVDGMTSTALLLRTFKALQIQADYLIPSRMTEGYGINARMVQELHAQGVALIITVDNGISAHGAVSLAKELGMGVIITDHHELPEILPPADGILNPKQISPDSVYYAIAGVGVAYILGTELAKRCGRPDLEPILLELFTLGTIADLAMLTGINRQLLQRGLKLLANSQIPGIQALKQVAGINDNEVKPDAIGFSLGPRINAVGRIGDPTIVIDLLTTSDLGIALEKAMQCEQLNRDRQQLCTEIEQQAIAQVEAQIQAQTLVLERDRLILLVSPHWHHGVIGIVASRLVERFGAPVFMCAQEDQAIRSSVRGIPEFHVFEALQTCDHLLDKYGGHAMAGGFSTQAERLPELHQTLIQFAQTHLTPEQVCPAIAIDLALSLSQVSPSLYAQIERLQPCGIGNPVPTFASYSVQITSQNLFGKTKDHLSLWLDRGDGRKIKAIAWRWRDYYPLPPVVDIAYRLHQKQEYNETYLELELLGVKTPWQPQLLEQHAPPYPHPVQWQQLDLSAAIATPVLIYGQDPPLDLFPDADRDRPQKTYQSLVLWQIPPSPAHLNWLLHLGKPQQIQVNLKFPPIPSPRQILALIQGEYGKPQLNLMALAKLWGISPAAIVAGLRYLGISCPDYPPTPPLEQAIANQLAWYGQDRLKAFERT